MRSPLGVTVGAVVLATAAIGAAACGGDDKPTAAAAAKPITLDQFLMREHEEPGFRPGAQPDAMPQSRQTITGVDALAKEWNLSPADAKRYRDDGFISLTVGPIRGPQTAGLSSVALHATQEGAKASVAHEVRPDVIRTMGPVKNLHYFNVPGVPDARGFTASLPGEPASRSIGNVFWVQGRCVLVLGNQGPGPLDGPLSKGVRDIYERTNGRCP